MKINQIMENLAGLARSQGTYSRIYMEFCDIKENDPDMWNDMVRILEDEEFANLYELVMFLEEGMHSKRWREKYPAKKVWKIPVTWEVYSTVEVEADSMEEAIKKFNDEIDEIPLPTDPEYVDGSFRASAEGTELEALIECIMK